MKFILFCNLPYSFSILKPLELEIIKQGFEYIWYLPDSLETKFPYKNSIYTTNIKDLNNFNSDAIFVPGNDVPYYIKGLKVQIFHGLAGEKKGHFRIRDYFDLYLTQGPYFTKKFKQLALKHKNFHVIETGWCKLDNLYTEEDLTIKSKEDYLKKYNASKILLYAPTFSPSLTSAEILLSDIKKLSEQKNILVIIKFHDKMDISIIEKYKNINSKKLIISKEKDITKLLQISDLMISDTSSVVYEFLLLNKPVVTLNSNSENINWLNLKTNKNIVNECINILNINDDFKDLRQNTINLYHPYIDGLSSKRMLDETIKYIDRFDVPKKRNLSLLRKIKIIKKYGMNL